MTDKFAAAANVVEIQVPAIREVAESFAAINPGRDGWFTGSCTFEMVDGKVTRIDGTRIVHNPRVTVQPHLSKYIKSIRVTPQA